MAFEEINRFPELKRDLSAVFDQKRASDIAGKYLQSPADRFISAVLAWAPEGINAPVGNQPSQRIWGKTFAASWAHPVMVGNSDRASGNTVQIPLDHPSVNAGWTSDILDWLIYGTYPHVIRGKPKVHFWWGAPLQWPAKDGKPAGERVYFSVGSQFVINRGYWASPGFDFVTAAIQATEEDFNQARDEAADELLNAPLKTSDLLKFIRTEEA